MRKFLPLIILGFIILAVVLAGVGKYNSFVGTKLRVDNTWSDVEVQYKRRIDLIPNLVSTVKGAADFEQGTFLEVTAARSAWNVSQDIGTDRTGTIAVARGLDSALSRLLVVFENYPELNATEEFGNLMVQLEGTENRIAVAVRDYNEAVRMYNAGVQKFPGLLLAGIFGFEPEQFFESDAPADAPSVEF